MSLKYHLVLRPDMRKDAPKDKKLYYGQVRVHDYYSFEQLCETIADRSTASKGDVMLVIDGLLFALKTHLEKGETVQLGELGHFRLNAGSEGVEKAEDFKVSMFRKPKIVFSPGILLRQMCDRIKFEKAGLIPETGTQIEQGKDPSLNPDEQNPDEQDPNPDHNDEGGGNL